MKEIPKDGIAYQTFLIDNSMQGLHAISTSNHMVWRAIKD